MSWKSFNNAGLHQTNPSFWDLTSPWVEKIAGFYDIGPKDRTVVHDTSVPAKA